MTSKDKLKQLIIDVFLLKPDEFNFDLLRSDVNTWDSFGVVALATGIEETFSCRLGSEEAISIKGVRDIINILKAKGIHLDE